ncbi:UDP-glucose 6-dehydrogenase [Methanoregula boonei 6A8]|jgi:UDPglucose 6-dehydrogenase|uniref:UDP-glucose 6-dehydrogenase n=1 Tax=Methanoregula boonei (strain DSM 21154 / JCM 14090 / 6A8) TaxID=456442 RepID=A7I969_METB6|nr:UDP-glucose/GDP-mannose dehydrogenase family protein [Methanoregula boonei]ABS56280.1 UDP-glucose 6-dehydrogenase [Methanoregula boonei 6A8]
MSLKISIVGGGYVGLVTGTCFAELGHEVTIIEIDPEKVRAINDGKPPIFENGLGDLLKKNAGKRLRARTDYDSVASADIVFISVGTPPKPDGSANLSYIESASTSIGKVLKNNRSYCVITVKSTVPPGTTEKIVWPAVIQASGKTENEIGFAMNPEFLREGRAVEDFLHPDRIVIGCSDPRAGNRVADVYQNIQAPIIHTGLTAAEMIKYASNSFLATKISFSNEIGNLCKVLGIDVYEVMKGVGLDARIGPLFLNAGAGFGGSCFPKDVSALVSLAKENGEDPVLLESVLTVNEHQPHRMISIVEKRVGVIKGKRIAILGLAFKDNTDDIRDSRAIPVIQELVEKGACVTAYDPLAIPNMQKIFPAIEYCSTAAGALTGADACLVMTEWPEFSKIDKEFGLMAHKIVIEGRRILTWKGGEGICW